MRTSTDRRESKLVEELTAGMPALITCDDWFTASDGGEYNRVWGRVKVFQAKELFGFDPKAGANFFVQVGHGEGAVLIAGCRIHYATLCPQCPNLPGKCFVPPSERQAANSGDDHA